MNRESQQIADYIEDSPDYLKKIAKLKAKHNNIKDFTLFLSYCIMSLVSTEKKFINFNRKAIDLPALAAKFF